MLKPELRRALNVVVGCIALAHAASQTASASEGRWVHEALSPGAPSAFGGAYEAEDFSFERVAGDDTPIQLTPVPGSLEWVRVGDRVTVPRGLVRISAPASLGGLVEIAGESTPLEAGEAQALVAYSSHTAAMITLHGADGRQWRFRARFTPRELVSRVLIDASCSSARVALEGSFALDGFVHLTCAREVAPTDGGRIPRLLLRVYLEDSAGGGALIVDGTPRPSPGNPAHTLRLSSARARVTIASATAPEAAFSLSYRLPPRQHRGFVGGGIGPYHYRFEDADTDLARAAAIAMLYAGYSITPSSRIVYFHAAAADRQYSSDQGLFLNLEQVRFFDERISFNLLIGVRMLSFRDGSTFRARLTVPQGVEFVARDVFLPRFNAALGLFYLPKINGSAYINAWARWGTYRVFGEVNYLSWEEDGAGPAGTSSSMLGVTLGFRIASFP